jgi:iron complex outermembrane receptor protein
MKFRAYIAASASFTVMMGAASLAAAQQAAPAANATPPAASTAAGTDQTPADTTQTIVVTGVRQSVLGAQKIKRDSSQVVDSIVSEDIGKLPDDNVAEALQRVTGVQITRSADEGASVLIRGLPNVVTLLNGRELFTTTGRYVALADVPAAFLQRVDVYKSNAADQLEGGIAGTIDVRLHRPFDFKGAEVSATGRLIYSDLSHREDPNVAFLASDRWMTNMGEVGALFGVSYQERHYRNEIIDNFVAQPLLTGNFAGSGPAPTNLFFPGNIGQQTTQGDRKRPAANFAVQWRPNNDFEFYTEGFYTEDSNRSSTLFFVGLPNNTPAPPFGGVTSFNLFPNTNEVKSITSSNAFSIASTQAFQVDSQTYQIASGGSWTHGPMKISTDFAYTHSVFTTRDAILDTSFFTPNVTADTNHDGSGTPFLTYTGINLEDPTNFNLFQLFDDHGRDDGASGAARIDGVYTFDNSILKSVEAGFRFARRTAESNSTNPSSTLYPFQSISAASIPGLEEVSPSGFFEGDAAVGVQRFATPNPNFLLNDTNTLRNLLGYNGARAFDPTRFFGDIERTYAGYVQANTSFVVASLPVDGLFGVRLVQTDQALRGFNQVVDAATGVVTTTPLSDSKSNFDALPSVNIKVHLDDHLLTRFSYSKTVTRPDFSALNPAASLTNPGATLLGTGTGGNADLNEVKSDNYDLALEWYFARTGSLYGTAFYRDINGYIQSYAAPEVIGGQTFAVTRPRNTGSGRLEGLELGYTQFYDFVPNWLKGIGLQLNFTYIDGVTQSPGATATTFGPDQALVGVSRYTVNAIGLYERGPFSARIAYNWRSKYVDSYNNTAAAGSVEPATVEVAPLDQLDMSFGYRLSTKMTLTLDWVNALDSVYHDSFGGSPIFPRDTRRSDETVELGFRWSL